jgi:hypothetical protein
VVVFSSALTMIVVSPFGLSGLSFFSAAVAMPFLRSSRTEAVVAPMHRCFSRVVE